MVEVCYNENDYYADQLLEYLEGNLEYLNTFVAAQIPEINVSKTDYVKASRNNRVWRLACIPG